MILLVSQEKKKENKIISQMQFKNLFTHRISLRERKWECSPSETNRREQFWQVRCKMEIKRSKSKAEEQGSKRIVTSNKAFLKHTGDWNSRRASGSYRLS